MGGSAGAMVSGLPRHQFVATALVARAASGRAAQRETEVAAKLLFAFESVGQGNPICLSSFDRLRRALDPRLRGVP